MGYGITRIGRNTIDLSYRLFLDWVENSVIFWICCTVHLGFPTLFIWAVAAIFFLLI
jgi:hypothetical protein